MPMDDGPSRLGMETGLHEIIIFSMTNIKYAKCYKLIYNILSIRTGRIWQTTK